MERPRLFYRTVRAGLRVAFRLFCGLERVGLDRLPETGPCIVACNHASYLDPPILGAAFERPLHFMARKSLFDNRCFAAIIRGLNAFPVERDGDATAALKTVRAILREGGCVVLFPEGTRTEDGRLGEIRPGVGLIAARAASPVLPVYIRGSFEAWPRGRTLPRPAGLRVEAGEPVAAPDVSGDRAAKRAEQERVNREVAERLRDLEHRLRGAPPPDADISPDA